MVGRCVFFLSASDRNAAGTGHRLGAIIKPFFCKLQLESLRNGAAQTVAKMNGTEPQHSYRVNDGLPKTGGTNPDLDDLDP
ncbi:hypothetical protein [Rhizobium yanglingense]